MKGNRYIYAVALVAMLSACRDESAPTYSVGAADNAIVLRAGVGAGEKDVQTKASETPEEHAVHQALTTGTKVALRIDGTWTGHGTVSQTTTATIGAAIAEKDSKHNSLSMQPVRYWDDYGTADPANTTGREAGLSLYGVAVDAYQRDAAYVLPAEEGRNLATVANWQALPWTLPADQTGGWADYDLLSSNNIRKVDDEHDYALKFDDVIGNTAPKEPSDLLVFTHAMSKVTVHLTAGKGFDGGVFATPPTVTLLNTYRSGMVDVEQGATAAVRAGDPSTIALRQETTPAAGYTATFTGLMMPGNRYTDSNRILRVRADGNIYFVTAAAINAVNPAEEHAFERGKHYIFKVVVDKTEIEVTATVTDWVDLEADTVTPTIDVTAGVGTGSGSSASLDAFSFYRFADESLGAGVARKTGVYSADLEADGCYKEETVVTPSGSGTKKDCVFGTPLYWRDHQTHYHFRGVYPRTATTGTSQPLVQKDGDVQCIRVWNGAYSSDASAFPSNLLIGAPEIDPNTECGSPYHAEVDMAEHGICAREAAVNLNFRYMMAQVVVNLRTTDVDNAVNLGANTKVEIEGGYTKGYVGLHSRSIERRDGLALYPLHNAADDKQRHDAIVPQPLDGLRFKISVMTADGSAVDDVYTAEIKNIPVRVQGSGEAYSAITEWKAGEKYVYTLLLTKTEIKVTATITDWTTLESGDTGIWF